MSAARELGNAGVKGYDNPAALNLYGIVRNFDKIRTRLANGVSLGPIKRGLLKAELGEPSTAVTKRSARTVAKRASNTCYLSGWWGSLISYQCYKCPLEFECLGMCGNDCNCWDWVCGDCCFQQGCYEHDRCCLFNGFFHHTCLFVFPFTCSGYHHDC